MIVPIKAVIVEEMRSGLASDETLVSPAVEGLDVLNTSPVDDTEPSNNTSVTVPTDQTANRFASTFCAVLEL
ncbi:hypothetical protein QCA50_012634 [Cerrena zonata]|uniref:Uncharacterized protein n=1 Tax=Cerrena zonata TaxID=2478898 RepID=A0AAW0G5N8_9APHY